MKRILIVTHGESGKSANSFMIEEGERQIKQIKNSFRISPDYVVAGNAFRYTCVADALGVEIDCYDAFFGDGSYIEDYNGEKVKIYPDGWKVLYRRDKTEITKAKIVRDCLLDLPNNTLICTGRGLGIVLKEAGLMEEEFQSASLYRIMIDRKNFKIEKIMTALSKAA